MPRVLVATDGSDCAIHAARVALGVLGSPAHLTIMSVIDVRSELAVGGSLLGTEPMAMSLADPGTSAELDEALVREATEAVQRTAAALGTADYEPLVTHGEPASDICRRAEEGGYDVIVVGSHGSGFVKRVLVGSVSSHVVHHATVPVLVVRQPAAAG